MKSRMNYMNTYGGYAMKYLVVGSGGPGFASAEEALLVLESVVLPSFDEETGLFGDKSPADTVARYRELGADTVVVKNGGHPVTFWDNGDLFEVPTARADVVTDTTAAGDSFAAGFLAAIATGANQIDAVKQASELASKVIGRRGALVPEIFEGE